MRYMLEGLRTILHNTAVPAWGKGGGGSGSHLLVLSMLQPYVRSMWLSDPCENSSLQSGYSERKQVLATTQFNTPLFYVLCILFSTDSILYHLLTIT